METIQQLLEHKADQQVWSIEPEVSVQDAMRRMADHNIGALPVLQGDKLVGMISERDIARKLFIIDRPAHAVRVSEVMSSPVIYVLPHQTRDDCMALVTNKRVRHLPVLDQGKLLGVISIGDLVRATIAEQQFIIEQLEHYITDTWK
jgi:CBS domain-containing protein